MTDEQTKMDLENKLGELCGVELGKCRWISGKLKNKTIFPRALRAILQVFLISYLLINIAIG